jgi:2-polyprenyl-6-methoxyphenol hydroxylase-like FAD-dependent oxidoreductase
MLRVGGHAVVIGASMGGLLAARALADHFDQVTLVERDQLPDSPKPRKGVPQGQHTHGLLARGRAVLELLFPGFTAEMVARGALSADIAENVLWFNYGVYLKSPGSRLIGLAISRPMLEGGVRERLLRLPNIQVREQLDVLEPVVAADRSRVTGVRVQSRDGSDKLEEIGADLVVDATGRGSSSPDWLARLGYPKPREERIKVNLGYVTREYRRLANHLHGKTGAIIAACRPDWRFGVILAQEGDRWIVTLGGYLDDHVSPNDAAFLEFARSLPTSEIFDVIRSTEPLSPLRQYKFTTNLRRHYEEVTRFPEGLLVYGDALCSFNPVYGQGMTVACVEALALRECLMSGAEGLAGRFFRAASKLIDIPWQIAVGSDLQHPGVVGERTMQVRFVNWYIARLYQAAHRDSLLAHSFLEVANLMRRPVALLAPRIAWRVFKSGLGLGRVGVSGQRARAATSLP